jgi:hypothetical protein
MKSFRLLLLLLPIYLTACTHGMTVHVDSISDQTISTGKSYLLKSGMPDVKEDDLYFKEFSSYFHKALANKGFKQVNNKADASIVIYFIYGISDGITHKHVYTTPVYDWLGPDIITYEETKTDPSGKTTTVSKLRIPETRRVVGREVHVTRYTTFTGYATLVATQKDNKKRKPHLWKTSVQAIAPINDLRRIMPVMAAAAIPYIASNTGQAIVIKIREEDKRVQEMKR